MGDQMQLGQPSQGSHPGESGLSVLDYLLHKTPTIPDDMGVFLGTTYRMHSEVNKFISGNIDVIDIKLSTSCAVYGEEQIYCFTALIMYEEKES